jgi:hypothetical protein
MEPSTANYFGRPQYTAADHYIDAKFDEFRLSRSARSAQWISTAYNNQNAPASFITLGASVSATTLCALLPITLLRFDAEARAADVELRWATASETDNAFFLVVRSRDQADWEVVGRASGAGTTHMLHEYRLVDSAPLEGVSYYRLRQVDTDGTSWTSPSVAVDFVGSRLTAYPVPVADELRFAGRNGRTLRILDVHGRVVAEVADDSPVHVADWPRGTYVAMALGERTVERLPFVVE